MLRGLVLVLGRRPFALHVRELCYLLLTPVTGILFVRITLQWFRLCAAIRLRCRVQKNSTPSRNRASRPREAELRESDFILLYRITAGIEVILYGACMAAFLRPFLDEGAGGGLAQVHQIALVDAGELSAQLLLQLPYLSVVFHCAFL